MATDCIAQVTFQGDGFAKPVVARFDLPDASADGGLMLVKALDTQLGLSERLAACLDDAREPGKVLHETIELMQQRIFGLCAGYADCNDAARLVHDPIHKLMVGRDPLTGLRPGLAADAVALRERRARARVARYDARAGRHRDRAATATSARARHPDHDRPGSHRRPHSRPAGVRILQRSLRYVVLPAGGGHRDVQRRAGPVCSGRGTAPGQSAGQPGSPGHPAGPAAQAPDRLPGGHVPGPPGRGLCQRQAVPVSGARTGRVRRRDGEQSALGEARSAAEGQGPGPLPPDGRDGASVRRDAVRPGSGRASDASSSRPRSSGIRAARPRTIPGLWSPI